MAKQDINIGAFPGDTSADVVREAFRKAKENFTELYERGQGDMLKSTYDSDNTGIVDAAEKVQGVDGHTSTKYYGTDANGVPGFFDLVIKADNIVFYTDSQPKPLEGVQNTVYIDKTNRKMEIWDGFNYQVLGVDDAIVDGVVDKAPSQNVVFDKLALKADDSEVVKKTTLNNTALYNLSHDQAYYVTGVADDYSDLATKTTAAGTYNVYVIKTVSGNYKCVVKDTHILEPEKAKISFQFSNGGLTNVGTWFNQVTLETTIDGFRVYADGLGGSAQFGGFDTATDGFGMVFVNFYSIKPEVEKYPFTDEFVFTTGDPQVKTLTYTPLIGLVQVFVQGVRLFSTQYNLLNEKQVEILDTLTDGDTIAVDYTRLTDELVTLLLLTPQGGIEDWTVDRNSEATYVDENGVIQTAAPNEVRIDYSTGNARILVEGQSTNIDPNSSSFDNWIKSSVSINTGNIIEDTTYNLHRVNYQYSLVTGDVYSLTFLVDKNSNRRMLINASSAFNVKMLVDVNACVEINNSRGVNYIWSEIKDIGEFCKVSITAKATSTHTFYIQLCTNDYSSVNDQEYLGDGSSYLNIPKRQVERASQPTSYIPTNGTTVTRLADVITKTPPQGTNKIIETVDGVTNEITTIPATYQLPVGNVEKIEMV